MRRQSSSRKAPIAVAVGCSIPCLFVFVSFILPVWYSSYVHATRYKHYDLLMNAIYDKDLQAVKAELDKGTNPNTFPNDAISMHNEEDIAPLCVAADQGDVEIVKLLLDRGADPNISDGWNGSPLDAAAIHNNLDLMELLIARGAKVNDRSGEEALEGSLIGSGVLWQAAVNGRADAVSFLLAHGADPNTSMTTNGKRETLLYVVEHILPNPQVAEVLKKAGATE